MRQNSVNHDLLGQTLIADQESTRWEDTILSLTLKSFYDYTQCVKLHSECKITLGVCIKQSVINHWMGVKTTYSV